MTQQSWKPLNVGPQPLSATFNITTALSNSMGFGGHNASLIFAKG
jgi:3-oxoacyl-(acyl-carrier-protein) synthase